MSERWSCKTGPIGNAFDYWSTQLECDHAWEYWSKELKPVMLLPAIEHEDEEYESQNPAILAAVAALEQAVIKIK